MILYPAIDLKEGQAVRLLRGEMGSAQVFNADPAAQARAFVAAGCRWLHLVDLDGAFAGTAMNGAAVEAILAACPVPVQLGGGIRDMGAVEGWLARGVARVILGTVAVENPALVREAARAFPGQVAVGIDAREGRVATRGWAETTAIGTESSLSSEMQFGSLTNAAFGAVSEPEATVAHGFEVAQSVAVVADQPVGRAGGVTVSKLSEHGVGPPP